MPRSRYSLLLLLLFLLALLAPAAAGATTFGADVNSDFYNQVHGFWSQAKVMSDLHALHAAGGRVGRADSDWRDTEPSPPAHGRHRFRWGYDDLVMSEMAAAHLRWEPTLAFAPRWAEVHRSDVLYLPTGRIVAFLPPAGNGTFAFYASAFMKRYGPRGAFWRAHRKLPYDPVGTVEVWNEPDNIHDWGTGIDLGDYARMYEVVRSAVHHVDPRARVMTGGLAWVESSLPRLLKAFRGEPIDAVAIHPYAATPRRTIRIVADALADMRLYGRGATPVSVNEYGWTSIQGTWGSTSPRHVGAYVYRALIGLSRLRVAEVVPFTWGMPSWGLMSGSFARALAKLRR